MERREDISKILEKLANAKSTKKVLSIILILNRELEKFSEEKEICPVCGSQMHYAGERFMLHKCFNCASSISDNVHEAFKRTLSKDQLAAYRQYETIKGKYDYANDSRSWPGAGF